MALALKKSSGILTEEKNEESCKMELEEAELLLVDMLVKKSLDKLKKVRSEVLEISRLTGDASTRRYFRVLLRDEGRKNYLVVCLMDSFSGAPGEHDFLSVQEILKSKKVRVPEIIDHDLSSGYILQEDLGDQTLLLELSHSRSSDEELKIYENAIDNIVKMHQIKVSDYRDHIFSQREFDREKFLYEFRFMVEHFLEKYLNQTLSKSEKLILENGFDFVIEELLKRDKVFTHRDYHSRNLMIKEGDMVVIDFQDARLGPVVYDLVSLLEDSYYQVTEENKAKLIEQYAREMNIDWKDYQRAYDLMVVQRTLKAIGSFTYIYNSREDNRYLKYVGFAFEKVRSTLVKFPELYEFRELISKIYYGS